VSPKSRRPILAGALLGLAAIAIAAAAFAHPRHEPTYKGWTMHEWLQQHYNTQQYEALIILGTNNLPLLIKRIGYDEKSDRIISYYRKLPPWLKGNEAVTKSLLRRSTNKTAAADEAKAVLEIVGHRAAAAVPQLIQLAREKPFEVGERVVVVLDWMGEPGIRPLISLTDHTNQNLVMEVCVRLDGHRNSPLLQSISNVNTRTGIYSLDDYKSISAQLKSK
jgi:hypothetical protein